MSRVRFRRHGDCSRPYLGADRLHGLTRQARTRWGVNREGDVAAQVRQAHADNAPPQSANLSVEQMESALARLEKRLDELRAFDPTQVTQRDDIKLRVLENAVDDFLTRTFGKEAAEYKRYAPARKLDTTPIALHHISLSDFIQGLQHGKERAIGILEGIKKLFLEEIDLAVPATADKAAQNVQPSSASREIFIVHGSDHGARDTAARFLKQLDLSPIILDEQSSKGRTIHQKFLDHSTVAYAVVLFTPDDLGRPSDDSISLSPRPRQNVIYELGFLSAKLGSSNVCVLLSDDVEIPSDLSGVVYIPLDKGGAWRLELAKEIKAACIELDMNLALPT